jgi:hypothetical protein
MTDDNSVSSAESPNNHDGAKFTTGLRQTRRGFFTTVGAGVLTGTTVGSVSGGEDKVEILLGIDPDGERKTTTVNKDWWKHVSHVEETKENVDQQLRSTPGVVGVGIRKSDQKIGGRDRKEIRVTIDEDHSEAYEAENMIPNEVDGVPIRTTVEGFDDQLQCASRDTADPTAGGYYFTEDRGYRTATLFASAYHEDLEKEGMVTVAHAFYDSDKDEPCNDFEASTVYQDGWTNSDQEMDEPEDWRKERDYVFIPEQDAEISYSDKILTEIGEEEYGVWTNWGYLDDEDIWIHHMGAATGHSTGPLDEYDYTWQSSNSCIQFFNTAFLTESGTAGGDSGGPHYIWYDDQAWIVGMHVWGRNSTGNEAQCNDNEISELSGGVEVNYLIDEGLSVQK